MLRLDHILPNLILDNQLGFVKGRRIFENIMLAQKIIQNIISLIRFLYVMNDMVKAYDRVSWAFTSIVMRKIGFGKPIIDMVWRIMSNNWYSVIVNGTRYGFFRSIRGLKQGDLLSPTLFILGAEVLSRMLNMLHHNQSYKDFRWK